MRTTVPSSVPPNSASRYERSIASNVAARAIFPAGVNSSFRTGGSPVPITYAHASGARIVDIDGNSYIDYALGMGPAILGHAPREVIRAVSTQIERGFLFAGQHELEIELGSLLIEALPYAEMVRLGSSGSEMVQLAVRVARAVTGRRQIVKFEGHYHGWLDSLFVGIGRGEAPRGIGRALSAGQLVPDESETAVLPWNDTAAIAEHLDRHGNGVAAVLMEPILCNTGVILPEPGYLQSVRSLCDQSGSLLIYDEVITGFRVALGGAQALLGVAPDLGIYGKALASGFPIAALAGRAEFMELIDRPEVVHGGTYNTNVASTSAAVATLKRLSANDGEVLQQMTAIGSELMRRLSDLAATSPTGVRMQGIGSVFNSYFGVEGPIASVDEYRNTDRSLQEEFIRLLGEEGVRTTQRGTWFLSAAHDDGDIEDTVAAAAAALARLA